MAVLAIVGAIGFAAVACKTEADGPDGGAGGGTGGGNGGETPPQQGIVFVEDGDSGWAVTGLDDTFMGTSLVIPDRYEKKPVVRIEQSAFSNKGLTEVTIGSGVTDIGSSAFKGNQLTEVTIPDGVTSIGSHAFSFNQLTEVTIGNGVTSIGEFAFLDNRLTEITIGAGVDISSEVSTMGVYDSAFKTFYNDTGKQAGTYVYSSGAWNLL